jgi:sodium-dependent phosphate cotransporter
MNGGPGEEALAPRSREVEAEAVPAGRRAAVRRAGVPVSRAAAALTGIFLFILGLQVLKTGARTLVPLLDGLDIAGPVNSVGFGWLLAYAAMSGSPVAAIGVTLLAGGVLSESEAFGVIGGSRLGASFIVLAVGFVLYVARKRNPDSLAIGVISLLTTFTTQGPAIVLGLISLHYGWLDRLQFTPPPGMLDWVDALYGEPVAWLDARLPGGALFGLGVVILLGSFAVFDRALPQLEAGSSRFDAAMHRMRSRWFMFLMGGAVTSMTMSVSISLTLLVPLSLKGYLKRDQVLPYVMGANITTFIDTLAGALILGGATAFTVVLTEMISVGVVSLLILTFFYGPYSRAILRLAHEATRSERRLAVFLAAIVAVPLVLLFA